MLRYVNILLFVLMIIVNYMANALPINGKTTGELSGMYPNLFVPAGITFSIWGIIYVLLGVFLVLQFNEGYVEAINKIGYLFALTSLFNCLWILAWHYQKLAISLLIMLGLLVALVLINYKIRALDQGMIKAAFGVYLGWICIATIANVTALLVYHNWKGFGIPEEAWAIVMIAIGALIILLSVRSYRNPFIGIAAIWAFLGIALKRKDDYSTIVTAAIICAVLVGVFVGLAFMRKRLIAS